MLKPSELTPFTSELLAELVLHYFDSNEFVVVLGDASVGQAFRRLVSYRSTIWSLLAARRLAVTSCARLQKIWFLLRCLGWKENPGNVGYQYRHQYRRRTNTDDKDI
ncbi:MAG: hypothetical protein ACR5LD_08765 [Symbiopectobacterium sp.]